MDLKQNKVAIRTRGRVHDRVQKQVRDWLYYIFTDFETEN